MASLAYSRDISVCRKRVQFLVPWKWVVASVADGIVPSEHCALADNFLSLCAISIRRARYVEQIVPQSEREHQDIAVATA